MLHGGRDGTGLRSDAWGLSLDRVAARSRAEGGASGVDTLIDAACAWRIHADGAAHAAWQAACGAATAAEQTDSCHWASVVERWWCEASFADRAMEAAEQVWGRRMPPWGVE